MAASILGDRYFPYVVFQDLNTGKFVQFAGDQAQPLLLDLPLQSLAPDEHNRASGLFSNLGIHRPQETRLYSFPSGEPGELSRSYQLSFDRDVEAATSTTLDVFSVVFRIPAEALQLDIEEE